MHFQLIASLAVASGLASAAPTGDKVTLHDKSFFEGNKASWPIDNKCHAIKDEASKLKAVTSIAIAGDVVCYLNDKADCKGDRLDIHNPGVPDLMMLLNWSKRAEAMKCGPAEQGDKGDKTEEADSEETEKKEGEEKEEREKEE